MSGDISDAIGEARRNNPAGREKLARQGKLYPRDRIELLVDRGTFVEDGLLANALADGYPADGVVYTDGHTRPYRKADEKARLANFRR